MDLQAPTTLTIRPERSGGTALVFLIAIATLFAAVIAQQPWWIAGSFVLGGVALVGWSKRIEITRDGDQIRVEWRGLFASKRVVEFRTAAVIGVFPRWDGNQRNLSILTSEGDVVLAGDYRQHDDTGASPVKLAPLADEIRVFLS